MKKNIIAYIILTIVLCFLSAIVSGYFSASYITKFHETIWQRNSINHIEQTVSILNQIRNGEVEKAAEHLEKILDVYLSEQVKIVYDTQIEDKQDIKKAIQIAKKYRTSHREHNIEQNLAKSIDKVFAFANYSSSH